MKTQCVVKLGHDIRTSSPEDRTQPFDRDRADLFGLSFEILTEPGRTGGAQSLEREDMVDAGPQGIASILCSSVRPSHGPLPWAAADTSVV